MPGVTLALFGVIQSVSGDVYRRAFSVEQDANPGKEDDQDNDKELGPQVSGHTFISPGIMIEIPRRWV
jgi:hypothetical protein